MKIDIFSHGNVNKFPTKYGAYCGGAVGYAYYLMHGLLEMRQDVYIVVNDEKPRNNADVSLLCSIGVDGERNDAGKRAADRKYEGLKNKPIIPLIHGVTEFKFYSHSLQLLKDLNPPLVLITTKSKTIEQTTRTHFPNARIEVLPIPFVFSEQPRNQSIYHNTIASPARIAAIKNTGRILDIAQGLPDIRFLMCGEQSGMYWFWGLSKHPYAKSENVTWLGAQEPGIVNYQAAFSIDLSAYWNKGQLEGGRVQYTTLEAVNAGCIPITFDQWKFEGGWDGIFLPRLTKGPRNRILWDKDACLDLIRSRKYDYDMVVANFEKLQKLHDYRNSAKIFLSFSE